MPTIITLHRALSSVKRGLLSRPLLPEIRILSRLRRLLPRSSRESFEETSRETVLTLPDGCALLTWGKLCDFIAEHPSLESARIVMCCSYRQRSAFYVVTHRFLILQVSRPNRDDVWFRLDRGRAAEVGPFAFSSARGVTSANDTASLSRFYRGESRG